MQVSLKVSETLQVPCYPMCKYFLPSHAHPADLSYRCECPLTRTNIISNVPVAKHITQRVEMSVVFSALTVTLNVRPHNGKNSKAIRRRLSDVERLFLR
jgi:hypothetical protein